MRELTLGAIHDIPFGEYVICYSAWIPSGVSFRLRLVSERLGAAEGMERSLDRMLIAIAAFDNLIIHCNVHTFLLSPCIPEARLYLKVQE